MARKFGKTYEIGKNFWNYSYIFNGVAGIGKTTMAHELGEAASGSNEGTFIITCGREPDPSHIVGKYGTAFGDKATSFKEFKEMVAELCENKAEYPDTKFVCWDSLDEIFRIAETYVVAEYNKALKDEFNATPPSAQKKPPKYAKSIAQSYGGFQKGESRVVDIIINEYGKLIDAGYKMILLGHTKVKNKTDLLTGVTYEQIGCNLDNKYYNALKDKVNLVCTAYFDHEIEDVKEETNAFTKKKQKKGTATNETRMAIFLDDNMAVDTKTHFANITPKIEFNSQSFIEAVQNAINEKINSGSTPVVSKPSKVVSLKPEPQEEEPEDEELNVEDDESIDEVDDVEETVEDDEDVETSEFDRDLIKAEFKKSTREVKDQIKAILAAHGDGKVDGCDDEGLAEVCDILGI